MDKYNSIRQQLLQKQAELEARISGITREVRHEDQPLDQDFAEQAVERQNDEVLDALDAEARVELSQVRRALQRLDDGSYGTCVACGAEIAEERLQALPFAERCINCAQ